MSEPTNIKTVILYEASKGPDYFRVVAKFLIGERPAFPWIVVERRLGTDALGVPAWSKESVPHIVQELTMGAFVMILDGVGKAIEILASSEQPGSAVEDNAIANPIDNVYPVAAPPSPPSETSWWLVERHLYSGDPGGTREQPITKMYWCGFDSWRDNKNSAIHLYREEDGNRIVRHLTERHLTTGSFKVVKHTTY